MLCSASAANQQECETLTHSAHSLLNKLLINENK